ncbi:HK97-gp10 family putative phage morphogenesis protein [Wukongibacter sp. M2B1]|uniref:HK97-gp10 family putative phage morphogenesis protein n=1 Tax=Wukongibacter sp. M2B1 TaxID=3088895 RepID=UPI003D78C7D5
MANGFEVQGMKEIMNKLEQMGKKGSKIENTAIKKGGEILKDGIKEEIIASDLIDEGDLLNNIDLSKIKKNKEGKFLWVGDVDGKAVHGWYKEFGTSKEKANPFMSRSFEKNKERIQEAIADEIRKGVGL